MQDNAADPVSHEQHRQEDGADQTAIGDTQAARSHVAGATVKTVAEIFDALQQDLPRTALHIDREEFSRGGSGHLGNLFRLMETLHGEALVEAWSSLLNLAETLWDAEEVEASLKLTKTASVCLNTPRIFEDRVSGGIANAETYLIAVRAEKRFDQGDTDAALNIAAAISGEDGESFRRHLSERATYRRRSRTMSLGIAGISIAILLGLSASGAYRMYELLQDPPRFELPEFDTSALSRELEGKKLTQFPAPKLSDFVDAAPASNDALQPSTDDLPPDEGILTIDTPDPQIILPESDEPSAPSPVKAAPSPQPSPEQEPQAVGSSEDAVANCALGQAVSRKAIALVRDEGSAVQRDGVKAFVETVNAACATLTVPQSEIDRVAAAIPTEQVDLIAKNIARP